ncbi:hypothetical protein WA577_002328 [Blastocystis sp. JDR]
MPVTPKFSISQDDEFVIIEINVPWVRVGDMEFVVDGCEFSFFCNPYLLKLQFPYPCIDDERAKAVYDMDKDNGTIFVHVPKEEKGRVFPDLDMFSTLLMKPEPMPTMDSIREEHHQPLVQEIKENGTEPTEKVEPSKTSKELLSLEEDDHPHRKYGFDDLFENVFKSFEDCSDVIENPVPDDSTVDPLELMKEMESAKFDADHYLSDYIYGKEDYLYTEFADRIIRKRLKSEPSPPLVPSSSWTESAESAESVKPMTVAPIVAEVKKAAGTEGKKPLIEVISETSAESTEETATPPRLDGELHYPSLLVVDSSKPTQSPSNPSQSPTNTTQSPSNPSQLPTNTSHSPTNMPTLSRRPENLSQKMREHIQESRVSHEEGAEDCRLTADEKELLLSIKSVPVTVPASRLRRALGSLVDVLCAYCYDVRITQHDPSPESAWTIAILSPTLSWLAPSEDLQRVLVHFARRVLIYPYLRRYDLARLCIKDCAVILKLGKRRVLKCLLEIKKIFKYAERKYILNTLYIDKFILWVQTLDYPLLFDVAEEITYLLSTAVTRESLDLGIPELDEQGKEIYREEQAMKEEE